MSLTEYSTSVSKPKSPTVEKHVEDDPSDKSTKEPGDKHGAVTSPDTTVMDRVLKQVGTTSSAFIGPAFPPPQKTAPKSDIEDSLSEFYKELESVEKTDAANGEVGTQDSISGKIPSSRISEDYVDGERCKKRVSDEKDFHLKSKRQKPSSPHWYHNHPYNVRASRPGQENKYGEAGSQQNHWFPPPPLHPPPFRHQPPSYAFPPPPPHGNPGFRMTNQQPGFPPSNVPSQPSFEGKPCRPIDRNQQFYINTNSQSDPHPTYREQRTDQWSHMKPHTHRTETDEDVWVRHHHYEPQDQSRVRDPVQLLVLMRGLPGCGKSTRARELLSTGPSGVILSTDDYFLHEHGYRYELGRLGAAHEWNQRRGFSPENPENPHLYNVKIDKFINSEINSETLAKDALNEGRSPVIIDNTNLQAWEMKPYVKMALERGYTVDFCEPQTSWKFDPSELERRNKHKVSREKIAQMMDRYSFPISVDVVMSSEEPPHVTQRPRHQPPQTNKRKHDFH